jgi:hypothetical protein
LLCGRIRKEPVALVAAHKAREGAAILSDERGGWSRLANVGWLVAANMWRLAGGGWGRPQPGRQRTPERDILSGGIRAVTQAHPRFRGTGTGGIAVLHGTPNLSDAGADPLDVEWPGSGSPEGL